MASKKNAVTKDYKIVRIKASEINEDDYLLVGSRTECEEFVTKNKPSSESQNGGEGKGETIAEIFNVHSDETRTTQENNYVPVSATKSWGAKNK